ncbi:fructose-bisphosphate aldolase class I [Methylohalomonas lacus]|uniref:Probable fructose-bisphosphate aldolase class 1 n=1 Tax=Methylohalomonas lacus TaxID=398773 RepID=A0AAE3L225_9GAMM|nr:class I fructose-bisphosphate aldolase [Methylohalomonas lacus]MCS3904405.1 fructose-bisphosphate aldolase class I [Methylohalomonas lacus]
MSTNDLTGIAQKMVEKGKGILAIDESTGTIKKRFDSINVESTEETRRAYRELLITTPGGNDYVSGMILYDETIRQKTADGTPFTKALVDQGIMPGIKVDTGAKDLAGHPDEKVTEGLDGLRERLNEYVELGAKFAKWRAVITIGDHIPSQACIEANCHALARYAALCQEAGLVPMVEPETLMDADNTIERCFNVTERTLHTLFDQLYRQGVSIEHTILKVNMVVSGKQCPTQAEPDQVADLTVKCLKNTVPASLPGIVFLSGGQSAAKATEHLNLMNRKYTDLPWPLSFSYGRALQEPCLKAWSGNPDNVQEAQKILLHREKCNGLATLGKYDASAEKAA